MAVWLATDIRRLKATLVFDAEVCWQPMRHEMHHYSSLLLRRTKDRQDAISHLDISNNAPAFSP